MQQVLKKNILKKFILLLSLIFISCNSIKIDQDEYTIIEYGNNEWTFMFENATPTELSSKEINTIEIIIKEKLIEHTNLMKEFSDEYLSNSEKIIFRRQYVPVILENGDKVVWINFMCGTNSFDDWKENLVIISDGGPCFFQLKVNLTTKQYYDYRYNGIALVENRCITTHPMKSTNPVLQK